MVAARDHRYIDSARIQSSVKLPLVLWYVDVIDMNIRIPLIYYLQANRHYSALLWQGQS